MEALAKIEELVFTDAQQKNTIEAYETYLSKYPKGKFVEQARRMIEIIKEKEFCKLATTSLQERTPKEIEDYYKRLEELSPNEIKDYVIILREGWRTISVSLREAVSGNIKKIERPQEVRKAAKNVAEYVRRVCRTEASGVYLVFPEIGLE
jgi:hypothetical protein